VQREIHCSYDQPSNSQEEYASECHITEEKNSPLNSGNVEQHNNVPCWSCHTMHSHDITCVFQKYPLHNNTEKHMAYAESILEIKCVSSFSTNTNEIFFIPVNI
jgi:hypothetical protein